MLSLSSTESVGSMILGGSRREVGELEVGRGRLWLLVGGVGCVTATVGVFDLAEELRLNGNAFRDALDGVERSVSIGEEREAFREGLGGTRASFGGTSLEARRGVKEWERVCVCDGVCCDGDKLLGADPEAGKTLRLGGEEERFRVTKGKSTFRCLLLDGDGDVVGVVVLLRLSLRFDLYLEILSCSSVSKGVSEGDFDLS